MNSIIELIDEQIASLQAARACLVVDTTSTQEPTVIGKRVMSDDGRKRISDAQKRRWSIAKEGSMNRSS